MGTRALKKNFKHEVEIGVHEVVDSALGEMTLYNRPQLQRRLVAVAFQDRIEHRFVLQSEPLPRVLEESIWLQTPRLRDKLVRSVEDGVSAIPGDGDGASFLRNVGLHPDQPLGCAWVRHLMAVGLLHGSHDPAHVCPELIARLYHEEKLFWRYESLKLHPGIATATNAARRHTERDELEVKLSMLHDPEFSPREIWHVLTVRARDDMNDALWVEVVAPATVTESLSYFREEGTSSEAEHTGDRSQGIGVRHLARTSAEASAMEASAASSSRSSAGSSSTHGHDFRAGGTARVGLNTPVGFIGAEASGGVHDREERSAADDQEHASSGRGSSSGSNDDVRSAEDASHRASGRVRHRSMEVERGWCAEIPLQREVLSVSSAGRRAQIRYRHSLEHPYPAQLTVLLRVTPALPKYLEIGVETTLFIEDRRFHSDGRPADIADCVRFRANENLRVPEGGWDG